MARVDLPKGARKKLCLSRQTLEGWRITVNSFIDLTKELLQIPGVEYVLSGKLNQDPLEQHFSKNRSMGGFNDNPNIAQFGHNERQILDAGEDLVRAARRGNVGPDE